MDKCEIKMVGDGAKDPKPNDNNFSSSDLDNLLLDKREAVSIFAIELSQASRPHDRCSTSFSLVNRAATAQKKQQLKLTWGAAKLLMASKIACNCAQFKFRVTSSISNTTRG